MAASAPSERGVSEAPPHGHGSWAAVVRAASATVGALAGVVPHLLHHVGLIAGTALLTGAVGNLLFGVVGLLLSVPLLLRLHRRFSTWKAPAIALALFAAMFALSALVIGPAITDRPTEPRPAPVPTPSATSVTGATSIPSATGSPPPPSTTGHDQHHGG